MRTVPSWPWTPALSVYTDKGLVIIVPEPKRIANLAKHGIDMNDFEASFSWNRYSAAPARTSRTGRARERFVGTLGGAVVVAIASPLGFVALSLVSIRPASPKEKAAFDEHG